MAIIMPEDFFRVDIRVGKIVEVEEFPEAKKPMWRLKIDFGKELGIKQSAATIAHLYKKEELMGRLIVAVVNFPPRQIASFSSECLVLGAVQKDDKVILLQPDKDAELGARIA